MNRVNSIVQPITPAQKTRRYTREEPRIVSQQEQHLQNYAEARRRQRRVTLAPKTETREEMEMARIDGFMTGIGLMASAGAIITALALLVHYFNWWILIVIACITGIAFCGHKLGWWLG